MDILLIPAAITVAAYMFVGRELLDNLFPAWRYWIGLETEEESLGFGDREVKYLDMTCDHHPAITVSDCNGCY